MIPNKYQHPLYLCSYDVIMKHALAKNHVNTQSRAYRKTKNNMPRWQLLLLPLGHLPNPQGRWYPNFWRPKWAQKIKEQLTRSPALEKARLEAELYSKKANLLFFNIPLASAAYMEDTEAVLRDHLATIDFPGSVALQFVNVHRLPTKNDSTRPDPIIAKFVTMKERNAVLNFKPSGDKKLSVAPHLPAAMQAARKRLVPIRNKKIAEGYAARIRVKGTEVHLLVNNAIFKPWSVSRICFSVDHVDCWLITIFFRELFRNQVEVCFHLPELDRVFMLIVCRTWQ